MAKISELITRTQYLIDKNLDAQKIIDLFNECLEDLGNVVVVAKTKTYQASSGTTTFTIPNDVIEIARVSVTVDGKIYDLSLRPLRKDYYPQDDSLSYSLFGDQLTLQKGMKQDFQLSVDYFGSPQRIPSLTEDPSLSTEPNFPPRYHRVLPLFSAIRYYENWEGGQDQRMTYLNEYEGIKKEMSYDSQRMLRRTRPNTVQIYRGWQ